MITAARIGIRTLSTAPPRMAGVAAPSLERLHDSPQLALSPESLRLRTLDAGIFLARIGIERDVPQGLRVTRHAVLLDLQAHQFPLGQGRSQHLFEPDGVHPLFHPRSIERAHRRSSHNFESIHLRRPCSHRHGRSGT